MCQKKYLLVVFVLALINHSEDLEFVDEHRLVKKLQVETTSGLIQGQEDKTVDKNVTYYKFQGIPYALPPLGTRRWKVPVPHPKWQGVLNASTERGICVQMSMDLGVEDCLFINVYTPLPKNSSHKILYPVMVWIYGGRFANGFSSYSVYGPDYILEHDVVFVSFNYRVGIFGFMSTEDLAMPGNYGLKDQLEALRWVQRNIQNFGGDPNNVTIFGDSAGGACVSYLLLIPQAKGLFHRAISASGSALCPWAFQREPKKIALKIAYACGIFESNTTLMVERMRKEDSKKMRSRLLTINIMNAMDPLNGLPFAPCLEPEHEEAVLTNRSNDLFTKGEFIGVPYMIGFTSQEASIVQDEIERTRPYIAHWDLMPTLLVPLNLNVTSKTKRKEIALKIKNFYFGKKYISMSTKTEMMNFIGDSQFVRSIRHNVQICAPYTNIYLYVFSYEGYIGRYGTKKEIARKVKGAGHVEDLFYLFKKTNLTTSNATDLGVIAVMTLLWTNFAKLGNPTPENSSVYWPPINVNDSALKYLNIDASLSIKQDPRAEAMDFWDDLYKEYGSSYYNTY